MTRILAIDPGNVDSAYALINVRTFRPDAVGKIPNDELRGLIRSGANGMLDVDTVAVEMIASYGMPVGREVFDTCVWIGRFAETAERAGEVVELIPRRDVKLHHCHTAAAKDANVIQALRDRFAYDVPNYGKGTKRHPGWFYGFHRDVWQAYALAVLVADRLDPQAVTA